MELVRTKTALARARRVLDDQRTRVGVGPGFNDYLPYALDCLAHVGRTLQAESKGRSETFDDWWKAQKGTLALPLSQLRNDELKEGKRRSTEVVGFTAPGGAVVAHVSDLRFRTPAGVHEVAEVIQMPAGGTIEWEFRGGPWDGLPVLDAMDAHWARLRDEIIPEAEQLLGPPDLGVVGDDLDIEP